MKSEVSSAKRIEAHIEVQQPSADIRDEFGEAEFEVSIDFRAAFDLGVSPRPAESKCPEVGSIPILPRTRFPHLGR